MSNQQKKLPAVSGASQPRRQRPPMRRPRARSEKTGAPAPARTRSAPPTWDPEPIFHSVVDELHFDPLALL